MKRFVPALLFMVGILGIWEITVSVFSIPEYLLPSPIRIVERLIGSFARLMPHLAVTAFEAMGGFILGTILGVLLAIVFVYSKPIEMGMYPYAIALKMERKINLRRRPQIHDLFIVEVTSNLTGSSTPERAMRHPRGLRRT